MLAGLAAAFLAYVMSSARGYEESRPGRFSSRPGPRRALALRAVVLPHNKGLLLSGALLAGVPCAAAPDWYGGIALGCAS